MKTKAWNEGRFGSPVLSGRSTPKRRQQCQQAKRRPRAEVLETRTMLAAHLTLQLDAATVNEGTGVAAITATLARVEAPSLTSALSVAIMANDIDELSFPSVITIPVDQTETVFTIDTINDASVDGTAAVSLTANAVGFESTTEIVIVTDDDTATDKIIGGELIEALPRDTYRVSHSLTIPRGRQRTISPGTSILFTANQSLDVSGSLIAQGTSNSPIILGSSSITPAKGDWTGIRTSSITTQLPTLIEHVSIAHATTGISVGRASAPITIKTSEISNNSLSGVFVDDRNGRDIMLLDSHIHNNAVYGIHLSATASGCNSAGTSIIVDGNEIEENANSGIYMFARASSGCLIGPGNATVAPLIVGNEIHDNVNGITGLASNSSNRTGFLNPLIQNNFIYNQISDGINLDEGTRGSNFAPGILNNTIVNNGGDGVVHVANTVPEFRLVNNIIQGNSRGVVTTAGHKPQSESVGFNNVFGNLAGNWVNYPFDYGQLTVNNVSGTPSDPHSNLSLDSQFDTDGLHLDVNSPLIGAGLSSNSVADVPTIDIDQDNRVTLPDIGADEVHKLIITFEDSGTGDFTSTALPETFQIREDTVAGTVNATIRRNAFDISAEQPFLVINPDPATLVMQAGASIPANSDSVTIPIETIDDGTVEFDKELVLRGSAPNTSPVGGRLRVVDDDVLPAHPIAVAEHRINQQNLENDDHYIDTAWLSNTRYVAVWRSTDASSVSTVVARVFDQTNQPLGNQFTIATLPSDSGSQTVHVHADESGDFVVAWTEIPATGQWEVFARKYNSNGVAQTAEIPVRQAGDTGNLILVDLAVALDGSWAILYDQFDTNSQRILAVRRFSTGGIAVGSAEVLSDVGDFFFNRGGSIDIAADGSIAAVWISPATGFVGTTYSPSTNSWSERFLISDLTYLQAGYPSVSFTDPSNLLVAYGRFQSSNIYLEARRLTSGGSPLTDVFGLSTIPASTINMTTIFRFPVVTIAQQSSGDFLLAWASTTNDIVTREFHRDGLPKASDFTISTALGTQRVPRLSLSPDQRSVLATWSGDGPGDPDGVYARQLAFSDPSLSLDLAGTNLAENAGTIATIVRRDGVKTEFPLTVDLISSEPNLVTVPPTVTIPAGATIATTTLNVIDNVIADGDKSIVATVTSGILSSPNPFTIRDDETPMLTLSFADPSAYEDGTTTIGVVTRNTPRNSELIVTLTSGQPEQATVPGSVTIPVGDASASFVVTPINDGVVDGTQFVVITGAAANHESGNATVGVHDIPALTVILPDTVEEDAGSLPVLVKRNTDTSSALTISLSSNSDLISGLGEFTIPEGASSITVDAAVRNDEDVNGDRSVGITALSAGFLAGSGSVTVQDEDVPELTFKIEHDSIDEVGGTATVTVHRNAFFLDTVVVAVFSNNDSSVQFSELVTIPSGESSISFPVQAIDNTLATGDQTVTFTAHTTQFPVATDSVIILDNETPELLISLNELSAIENGVSIEVSLERNTLAPLTATLTPSQLGLLEIPETIAFAQGELTKTFDVVTIDNEVAHGDRPVSISVSAPAHSIASADLIVKDNDAAELTLMITSSQLNESNGQAIVQVRRNTVDSIVLSVAASDSTRLNSPDQILLSENEVQAEFTVAAIDDLIVNGDGALSLTVDGPDLSRSVNITIVDDDVASFEIQTTNVPPLIIGESNPSISFGIVLGAAPISDVVLEVSGFDPAKLAVNDSTFVFTPNDWDQPQTITFVPVDDDLVEPTMDFVVEVAVVADRSASAFATLNPQTTLLRLEDDDVAGILIEETDGSTFVSETGITDSFHVHLSAAPQSGVTLLLNAVNLPGVSFDPNSIALNSENWRAPQEIIVRTEPEFDLDRTTIGRIEILISESTTAFGFASLTEPTIDALLVDSVDHDLRITNDNEHVIFIDTVSGVVLRDLGADPNGPFTTGSRSESILIDLDSGSIDDFVLETDGGDDTIRLATTAVKAINGGSGFDRLEVISADSVIDLDSVDGLRLESIEKIELANSQPQTLVLSPESVAGIVGHNGVLVVSSRATDTVDLGEGWQAQPPRVEGPATLHQLVFGNVLLELSNERPWTNPLVTADVDRSGVVTALDALRIINRLTRQGAVSVLPQPTDSDPVVDYFDVSSDGNATALDALRVINFIARELSGGGESENLVPMTLIASDMVVDRDPAIKSWAKDSIGIETLVDPGALPQGAASAAFAWANANHEKTITIGGIRDDYPDQTTSQGALSLLDSVFANWQGGLMSTPCHAWS